MPESLGITFWDVQHGNATHIRTPNNRWIVIDLGDADGLTDGARWSPLLHLRWDEGVETIDKLIITHPHRDHLDDISNLSSLNVRVLHRPKWLSEQDVRAGNKPEDGPKISEYFLLSAKFTVAVARPNDTSVADDWGGVTIKHFTSPAAPKNNLNNHGIVTFLTYANLTVLIPGDNEAPSWNLLLKDKDFRAYLAKVDVLLAPHHGREAGYCEDLFDAGLNPRITVISDDQAGSTSVTEWYGTKTRGWLVSGPNGNQEQRKCLTTRCDGTIRVRLGWNGPGRNFLSVTTEG